MKEPLRGFRLLMVTVFSAVGGASIFVRMDLALLIPHRVYARTFLVFACIAWGYLVWYTCPRPIRREWMNR
jgi:hypothetical protein